MSVTRGRLSRSQCLGTLCLKGEEGKRAKRKKKGRSFLVFLLFFLGAYKASWLCSGTHGSRKSHQKNAGFRSTQPRGNRFQAQRPSRRPALQEAYYLDPDSGGPFSYGGERDTSQPLTYTSRRGQTLCPRPLSLSSLPKRRPRARETPLASRRHASSSRTRTSVFHSATERRRVPAQTISSDS